MKRWVLFFQELDSEYEQHFLADTSKDSQAALACTEKRKECISNSADLPFCGEARICDTSRAGLGRLGVLKKFCGLDHKVYSLAEPYTYYAILYHCRQ